MELKIIAKNTGLLAAPKVLNFSLKLIRAKLNAILIGTTGVGIISQLTIMQQYLSEIAIMRMNIGAKKLVAQKKDFEAETIPDILKTYLYLIFPIIVVVLFLSLFFSEFLTLFLLGQTEFNEYFLIVFMVFPLIALGSVSDIVLGGFKRFKYIASKEIIISVLSFLLFIPLVIFFSIKGAVVNIGLTIIISFTIGIYFAFNKTLFKKGYSFKSIIRSKYRKIYSKEIIWIGGIGLTMGYYKIFCELTSRSILVNQLGIDKIGMYIPIMAWADLFTGFVFPAIHQYLFPRLCEVRSNLEIIEIVNDVFRFMTFILIPFVFLAIPLRYCLIPLFYSQEFISAGQYLPLHFIGIFFLAWDHAIVQIFVPTGRIHKLVPIALVMQSLFLACIYFLTPKFGLWAWTIRFSFLIFIEFFALFVFLKFEIGFSIKRRNLCIMAFSIFGSVLIWSLKFDLLINLLIAILLIFISAIFLKKSEKNTLKHYVRKKLKRLTPM